MKMRKLHQRHQTGASVLLMTSMLLVAALATALSSYRGVFYQIKITNNQIEDRQAHWRAEGGLECAFSSIVENNNTSIPTNLNSVCSAMDLDHLQVSPSDPERLSAKYGYREINKSIVFSGGGGVGAIKSTSDLLVFGSTLVSPPDPGPRNSDNEHECVAVVVSNYLFSSAGMTNHGVGSSIPKPSEDFDNSVDCASNHKTDVGSQAGIWQDSANNFVSHNVGNDVQRVETLNPFKSTFGFERGDWEQVREHEEYGFLSYTMQGADVNCVDKFKDDLVRGESNKIWIEGSCELNQDAIDAIIAIQSSHAKTYLFLLVHNGVLAIRGSGAIDGVVFHFNESFSPAPENWANISANTKVPIAHTPSNFDSLISSLYGGSSLTPLHATYLQSGSFKFTGGMVFDTQGQMALFDNSMRLQYNSDITSSFVFSAKPKWKKGSWYDR
ncbi:hypothetical protein [Vibrio sp. 10N.261.55.A7]|uniref:hypothetical protein n=1 Tax=Vibrio sp. 10N.261.55.A7 TaxID=1880851 RepID=UPI001F53A25F|nr:hypothetical protein [Vibrio sp. 10N.261.55.A7]